MTPFETPLDYQFPSDGLRKIDERVKYYRNSGSKVVHKEDCKKLASVERNQWLWATGKEPNAVVQECKVNKFGLKPCVQCFKEDIKESDG
jgi:hypothetical protein